jgi:hypothetical protein
MVQRVVVKRGAAPSQPQLDCVEAVQESLAEIHIGFRSQEQGFVLAFPIRPRAWWASKAN